MSGIDNNTLLYLRGDSFNDLGPKGKAITSTGCTLDSSTKSINATSGHIYTTYTSDFAPNATSLTAEAWFKFNSGGSTFTICFGGQTGYYFGDIELNVSTTSSSLTFSSLNNANGTQTNTTSTATGVSEAVPVGVWTHICITYNLSSKVLVMYINGKETRRYTNLTINYRGANYGVGFGYRKSNNQFLNGYIKNARISNVVRYTGNFTPQADPFTSVSVGNLSLSDNQLTFGVSKLSTNETISKVDILVNNNVVETITSNYDSISYTIDESTCVSGDNAIEVRAYYCENYYKSATCTYKSTIITGETNNTEIDSDLIFYFRGDGINDISPNKVAITNSGLTSATSGTFKDTISMTSGSATLTLPSFLTNPFTIEWYEYDTNAYTGLTALFAAQLPSSGSKGFNIIYYDNGTNGGLRNVMTATSNASSWDICQDKPIGNNLFNQWVHRCVVYDGTSLIAYENGKQYVTVNLNGKKIHDNTAFVFNKWRVATAVTGKYIKDFRIYKKAKYSGNFTPETKTLSTINIKNIIFKNVTDLSFSVEKLNNDKINKVEVLINNKVAYTETSNYDGVSITVNESYYMFGENSLEIRAYYYGDDYVSFNATFEYSNVVLDEINSITQLDTNATFSQVLDKIKDIRDVNILITDNLKKILSINNITTNETMKIGDMITVVKDLCMQLNELKEQEDSLDYIAIHGAPDHSLIFPKSYEAYMNDYTRCHCAVRVFTNGAKKIKCTFPSSFNATAHPFSESNYLIRDLGWFVSGTEYTLPENTNFVIFYFSNTSGNLSASVLDLIRKNFRYEFVY